MKAEKLSELVADFRKNLAQFIEQESNGIKDQVVTVSEANFFSKAVTVKPWEQKNDGSYPTVKTDNPAHDTLRAMYNVTLVGEKLAEIYEQSSSQTKFLWNAKRLIPKMTAAFNDVNKDTWMPKIQMNQDGSVNETSYQVCKQFTNLLDHVRNNPSTYFKDLGKDTIKLQTTIANMQVVGERDTEIAKPSIEDVPTISPKMKM